MKGTAHLLPLIGRKMLHVRPKAAGKAAVLVVDVRQAYGREEAYVVPCEGEGGFWARVTHLEEWTPPPDPRR